MILEFYCLFSIFYFLYLYLQQYRSLYTIVHRDTYYCFTNVDNFNIKYLLSMFIIIHKTCQTFKYQLDTDKYRFLFIILTSNLWILEVVDFVVISCLIDMSFYPFVNKFFCVQFTTDQSDQWIDIYCSNKSTLVERSLFF